MILSNGGSVPLANNATGFTPGASSTSLRGLGPDATLVLINGRRVAPFPVGQGGATAFVDLNSIPINAIERVEVLKDGASATYGADAIAGVVNIILRRDYNGAVATLSYGNTTNQGFERIHRQCPLRHHLRQGQPDHRGELPEPQPDLQPRPLLLTDSRPRSSRAIPRRQTLPSRAPPFCKHSVSRLVLRLPSAASLIHDAVLYRQHVPGENHKQRQSAGQRLHLRRRHDFTFQLQRTFRLVSRIPPQGAVRRVGT